MDLTLMQEHADAIALSSSLMRHFPLVILHKQVSPSAHRQLDQEEVLPV
jgi:hypothetical protein